MPNVTSVIWVHTQRMKTAPAASHVHQGNTRHTKRKTHVPSVPVVLQENMQPPVAQQIPIATVSRALLDITLTMPIKVSANNVQPHVKLVNMKNRHVLQLTTCSVHHAMKTLTIAMVTPTHVHHARIVQLENI